MRHLFDDNGTIKQETQHNGIKRIQSNNIITME